MSNTKTREDRLNELQDLIAAQDAGMRAIEAHAATLSAEGVELCVGLLPAELDALVETSIQRFRPETTIHYGQKA